MAMIIIIMAVVLLVVSSQWSRWWWNIRVRAMTDWLTRVPGLSDPHAESGPVIMAHCGLLNNDDESRHCHVTIARCTLLLWGILWILFADSSLGPGNVLGVCSWCPAFSDDYHDDGDDHHHNHQFHQQLFGLTSVEKILFFLWITTQSFAQTKKKNGCCKLLFEGQEYSLSYANKNTREHNSNPKREMAKLNRISRDPKIFFDVWIHSGHNEIKRWN